MGTVKNIFHRTGKLLTRRPGPVNDSGAPVFALLPDAEPPLPLAAAPVRYGHMEACLVHVEGAFDDAQAQAGAYSRRFPRNRVLARLVRLCRAAAVAR